MTNALDEDNYWEPCDAKPKSSGHGQYGFCQAGTSTAVDAVSRTTRLENCFELTKAFRFKNENSPIKSPNFRFFSFSIF